MDKEILEMKKRNTEEMKIWLFDLVHGNLSDNSGLGHRPFQNGLLFHWAAAAAHIIYEREKYKLYIKGEKA